MVLLGPCQVTTIKSHQAQRSQVVRESQPTRLKFPLDDGCLLEVCIRRLIITPIRGMAPKPGESNSRDIKAIRSDFLLDLQGLPKVIVGLLEIATRADNDAKAGETGCSIKAGRDQLLLDFRRAPMVVLCFGQISMHHGQDTKIVETIRGIKASRHCGFFERQCLQVVFFCLGVVAARPRRQAEIVETARKIEVAEYRLGVAPVSPAVETDFGGVFGIACGTAGPGPYQLAR